MKQTILTVVAVILAAFPFAAVLSELARTEGITTVLVFTGIALVLAVTVFTAIATTRPEKS